MKSVNEKYQILTIEKLQPAVDAHITALCFKITVVCIEFTNIGGETVPLLWNIKVPSDRL